ncbi:MAG: pyridoxamine 5'-phosphate oxidase family protein [Pseudomonadota bacterium]
MTDIESFDGIDGSDLPGVVWDLLESGVRERRHPFHTPILGNASGDLIEVRTVVLRFADAAQRALHCHTDIRSPKVEGIRENPTVSLLFYDAGTRIQLRVRASADIHQNNEIAEAGWAASTLDSRQCYRHVHGPSTPISRGGEPPQLIESDGYENFSVVRCEVQEIEWLFLRHTGHQRCRLRFDAGDWHSQWLAP